MNGGGYTGEDTFEFNGSGFTQTGSQGVVTGSSGDVQLTAGPPSYVTLYIPKPFNTPENVTVQIFGPCSGTAWQLEVNCPIELTGVSTSNIQTQTQDCLTAELPNVYYNVPNRNGTAGDPQVNEFYVQDPQGNSKVPSGSYFIEVNGQRKSIFVDANGLIKNMQNCT